MPASSRSDRGAVWVWAQFALMGAIAVLAFLPGDWPAWARGAGLVVAAAGAAGFAWSVRTLGDSLTPYPRPRDDGELVRDGPYSLVRHPIYAAGSLFFVGAALAASAPATVAALALPVLWWFKAGVEERFLAERFPEYADYRRRVPRRLFP